MYTDYILEEKERIQKELSRNADYDINKLIENIHQSVIKFLKETNTVLRYSERKGGHITLENEGITHKDWTELAKKK